MIKVINKQELIKATLISDKTMKMSVHMDEDTKAGFKFLTDYMRDWLQNNTRVNSYELQSLSSELLRFWNNSIRPETEIFWAELANENIHIERKDPLQFALTKNRFQRLEHGIDARNHWSTLKQLKNVQNRYSREEIQKIDRIIEEDETKRLKILQLRLEKKNLPDSLYLKYGECIAYFSNCKLFGKYFTQSEVDELFRIWNV